MGETYKMHPDGKCYRRDLPELRVYDPNADFDAMGENLKACPACGATMHPVRCKYVCFRCHYYESCSDPR